ncbi:MAG: MotA/TolQ/ExbB proton channel family protein [Thermodesulfobacteriota bacterium]|nr:MotA/TolQ/ExbB proton channel family protein [Thermodesulfobacteriota bacterium]
MIQKMILTAGIILFLYLAVTIIGETSMILNFKSGLLVFGGTSVIGFLSFPHRIHRDLFKTLYAIFRNPETDYQGLIKQIVRLSRIKRLYGKLTLEKESNNIENLFLRKGIELVVDGYDTYEIHKIMEKEYELHFSRKESLINILDTFQKLAPAIGFVGTIMGLIDVLSNIGTPLEMGRGMGIALLTTLYGLLFANFVFLPLSKKLSEHIRTESMLLYIILEGVLDISSDKNSKAVAYRLQSYIRNYHGVNEDVLEYPARKGQPVSLTLLQKLMARKQNA